MTMNALSVLKTNIRLLLEKRQRHQKDLARYCRHTEAWLSQLLSARNPTRGFPMTDLDRVADFFGVEVYQLFQPGFSDLAERRSGKDRRSRRERRVRDAAEILEETPSFAGLLEKMKRLSPEEYREFARRIDGALKLTDRTPARSSRADQDPIDAQPAPRVPRTPDARRKRSA